MDKTSFRKGHDYVTVVSDQDRDKVLHVADERKTASLESYYETLTDEQKEGIESVAMDMWSAYINAISFHPSGLDLYPEGFNRQMLPT